MTRRALAIGQRYWPRVCWGALLLVTTACFNRAALPLPGGVLQHPILEESASYQSDSAEIQVDVYRPQAKARHLTVLLLHSSAGIHDLGPQQITRYARTLAALGVTALVVHYFDGTGHFTASDDDEREYYWTWVRQVRDGISWALQQPFVHERQVELLGISLGAWVGVGVGAVDPRVHRVALIGSGLEPSVRDSLQHAPPALLLHGADDEVVPLRDAQTLLQALRAKRRPAQLHIYPRESHTLSDSASADALLRSLRFFRRVH
jgi:dienelactone hydrolase